MSTGRTVVNHSELKVADLKPLGRKPGSNPFPSLGRERVRSGCDSSAASPDRGIIGLAVARWWVVSLAPTAGAVVMVGAVHTGVSVSDTPAIVVTALAATGITVGVLARRRD
jgi:hypothetical protein